MSDDKSTQVTISFTTSAFVAKQLMVLHDLLETDLPHFAAPDDIDELLDFIFNAMREKEDALLFVDDYPGRLRHLLTCYIDALGKTQAGEIPDSWIEHMYMGFQRLTDLGFHKRFRNQLMIGLGFNYYALEYPRRYERSFRGDAWVMDYFKDDTGALMSFEQWMKGLLDPDRPDLRKPLTTMRNVGEGAVDNLVGAASRYLNQVQ